jgi:hypothetical protein
VLWCFNFSLFCSAAAMPMPWSCGWCGRRRSSGCGRGGGADREADGGGGAASGREEEQWSLFIELPVLEAATHGFSDDNLLGRGGFGPVYKASRFLCFYPFSPWLCFAATARLLPCFACGIRLTLTKTGSLIYLLVNKTIP